MFSDNTLGIDIGTSRIRFALIKKAKDIEVLDTVIIPTPKGSVLDGEIKDVYAVSNLVENVIKERKYKVKKLALCTSSPKVVIREFKIPTLKDDEIFDAIKLELNKNFPGIIETHSISFKINSRSDGFIRGITCACPNNVVEEYTNLGKNISVPLRYLDVNANSITKTYNAFIKNADEDESILIVDIGCNNSQVNIIVGGKLVLSRNVQSGGSSIDKIISQELNISLEEAEKEKLTKFKMCFKNGYDIDMFIKNGYAAIFQEIGQTLNFYNENGYGQKISNILLIGGGSFVPGIAQHLYDFFNIPTSVLRESDNNSVYISDFNIFLSAIGTALRED